MNKYTVLAIAIVFPFHLMVLSYSLGDKVDTLLLSAKQVMMAVSLKSAPQKKAEKQVVKKKIKKKIPKKKQVAKAVPQESVEEQIEEQKPEMVNTSKLHQFNTVIDNYIKPSYPRIAQRRRITGEVLISLLIKGDGAVQDILLVKSSGHNSLDQSALSAAKQWRFKQLSNNLAQVYKINRRVVFKL